MNIKDRLQYLDYCVAGERARFNKLLSMEVFNGFNRSYEVFRDYIRQKNNISDLSCEINEETLVIHINSNSSIEDLLSDNFPKKGITPIKTDNGVDLHFKLVEDMFAI